MKTVVVMAVRNGARYLEDALESIIKQSLCPDQIIIGDDNSTDASMDIILRYCKRFEFISVMERSSKDTLGVVGNFSHLAEAAVRSGADIVLFADQDDVWSEEKMETTIEAMNCRDVSASLPVLFHSDLRVVDSNLEVISQSYFSYTGLPNPRISPDYKLYVQNNVTGCTAACSAELLKVALPFPPEAVMHDWWLSLVCENVGIVEFTDRALVDYRQHGENVLGASKPVAQTFLILRLYRLIVNAPVLIRHFLSCHEQAIALRSRLDLHAITPSINLSRWLNLLNKSFVGRLREGGMYANNPDCPYEGTLVRIVVGLTPPLAKFVSFWRKVQASISYD